MCRLCAITSSFATVPLHAKRAIMHEMMLRGSADRQDDGWGVSDGLALYRGMQSYWKEDPLWYNTLDTDQIWIGHVRSASVGTERSVVASHPYRMRRDWEDLEITPENTVFMAAHNGLIQGTWSDYSKQLKDEPNTDSWRAFAKLRTMVLADPFEDITAEVVQTWLSNFESGSSFCFLIRHDADLIAVRGPSTRSLYCATIGDGFLVHTSDTVLQAVTSYAKRAFDLDVGEIKIIEEDRFCRFNHGQSEVSAYVKLDYKLKASPSYTYPSYQRTTAHVPAAPRQGRWVRVTTQAELDKEIVRTDDTICLELWCQIRNYLQPAREGLVEMLAANVLDIEKADSVVPHISWKDLTEVELRTFLAYAKEHKFTESQRRIINKWNKRVHRSEEIEFHWYQFGDVFLWDMPLGEVMVDELGKTTALTIVSTDNPPSNFTGA